MFYEDEIKGLLSGSPFLCEVTKRFVKLCTKLIEINDEIESESSSDTIILLDAAGLGDAMHTKIASDHLIKMGKKVVWITPVAVAELFKEQHNIRIFSNGLNHGECLRFKNCDFSLDVTMQEKFNEICNRAFSDIFHKFDSYFLSYEVLRSHMNRIRARRRVHSFVAPIYRALQIPRDQSIRPEIIHTGNVDVANTKPILCLETTSYANARFAKPQKYQRVINFLRERYDVVLVGGDGGMQYENAFLDFRGKSLYDTFSLFKQASAFVGRNSSNTILTAFKKDMPVVCMDMHQNHLEHLRETGYWHSIVRIDKPINIKAYCEKLLQ